MHAIGTEHDEQYEAQKYDNCRTNYAYKSRQKRYETTKCTGITEPASIREQCPFSQSLVVDKGRI